MFLARLVRKISYLPFAQRVMPTFNAKSYFMTKLKSWRIHDNFEFATVALPFEKQTLFQGDNSVVVLFVLCLSV